VDLRDHRPAGRHQLRPADHHDRSVSTRLSRLARYRAARERVLPRVSMRAFEGLVADALNDLPPYVQERLENVAVLVEPWPRAERVAAMGYDEDIDLLGLYEGISKLNRSSGYHLVTPDRITLFWRPLIEEVGDGGNAALKREIRKTVIHEVAHHFGIDDDELERLGG
jgi:predicted Zn-dependent protease with MMP-like domain